MAKKRTPLREIPLLVEVVNTILEKPELWDQSWWHTRKACGTAHCVAGWAQILGGKEENYLACSGDATRFLGLPYSATLFQSDRTLHFIYAFAEHAAKTGSYKGCETAAICSQVRAKYPPLKMPRKRAKEAT